MNRSFSAATETEPAKAPRPMGANRHFKPFPHPRIYAASTSVETTLRLYVHEAGDFEILYVQKSPR
jgi:hypothetical protein